MAGTFFGKRSSAKNAFSVIRPVSEPAPRPFDANDSLHREASLLDLQTEIGREVEVGGREPTVDVFRVAVLPFAEVSLHDVDEARVV
jgi:hypothetical protein